MMDEMWERAVEAALDGQADPAAARSLTLDGAVKCLHGRLPPPGFLERFENLHHLSIANTGVSSLEQFPRLPNLQKLILSDNRIAGGLEFLVAVGLDALRDLDLSNNRIQYIEDLAPLASLRLVSLDLYECPVTRVKDYRARVFGLIGSLRFLDKMDADGNERLESEDDEEEDDDEEDDDDPGSGEVDGEDRPFNNGHGRGGVSGRDGIVDVDEDDESDADEEETELSVSRRLNNGSNHVQANGFRVAHAGDRGGEDDEGEDDEDVESVEEIDDEEDGDEDVVEVHEVEESDNDDDGVEDEEDEEDDDDEDEEDVENEEGDLAEPERFRRLASTEGEIDAHEHGEDDGEEDDNGETGEEEPVEDDGDFEEEEEDYGADFLVRPVRQAEGDGYIDLENDEDDSDEEEVEDVQMLPSSSPHLKRRRDDYADDDGGDDDDGDDDVGDGEDDDDDDDDDGGENENVEYRNPSKKQR